ncbi:hypothetical protein KFZ70_09600 [Tamlana fucoidanivorans]|nr:hypothetical protein [Tamlana fucoidanivorans]
MISKTLQATIRELPKNEERRLLRWLQSELENDEPKEEVSHKQKKAY